MLITLNNIEAQLELNRIEKQTLLTHLRKNVGLQIYILLGTRHKPIDSHNFMYYLTKGITLYFK